MLTDNGIPQLSSTTRIVVAVDDINDHSPEFDQKFYKVQIPVNAKIDQALFQVSTRGNMCCGWFSALFSVQHGVVLSILLFQIFQSFFSSLVFVVGAV